MTTETQAVLGAQPTAQTLQHILGHLERLSAGEIGVWLEDGRAFLRSGPATWDWDLAPNAAAHLRDGRAFPALQDAMLPVVLFLGDNGVQIQSEYRGASAALVRDLIQRGTHTDAAETWRFRVPLALGEEEAAALLGKSLRSFQRAVKNGSLPGSDFFIGRWPFWRRSTLSAFRSLGESAVEEIGDALRLPARVEDAQQAEALADSLRRELAVRYPHLNVRLDISL